MHATTAIASLVLKRGEERRLRAGHCWIYSNEVDSRLTPLGDFRPGQQVVVLDSRKRPIGFGYVNPHSLICARLVSRGTEHPLGESLIVHRLNVALALRDRLYPAPFYRALFGESDGLPGAVVDRYGEYAVAQITTAGMEAMRDQLVGAVARVLKPKGILLRNDAAVRELEGLNRYVEVAAGEVPDEVLLSEGDCRFRISPAGGQKSGWYYDQSANRTRLLPYVAGKRVLDLFSYAGGWGIRCAVAGAASVTCIDSSEQALTFATANAELNGVADRVATLRGDAFELLRSLREAGERFDIVVADPPAFIKKRRNIKEGEQAYRRLNQAAMQLLDKEGLLVSSSCSHHMSAEGLLGLINQGARHLDRSMQLLERGAQAPDHPVHPAIPESAYLKCFYLRVLPAF